jgi:hypothetical protein
MNQVNICWPEQFPGEREMYLKQSKRWDKEFPGRDHTCECMWNGAERPCRHCPTCGRFVSNITLHSNELIGMIAVTGDCKMHGQVCVDMAMWEWEYFNE